MSALKNLSKITAKKRSLELLESVGLLNVKNKKIGTFSGGMRQRLGICQVLLNDPKLIILDEPTTGLDPSERVRFRNLLSKLSKEKTIILSTHIVSDIEFIASNIILFKKGRLIKNHKPENLISDIRGKVYTKSVPFSDINDYIASNECISTITQNEDGYNVRYISEKETSDESTEPNLEDVFLYYNKI